MSKIDRKRLARGTKLTPDHLFDPLTDGASTGAAHQINQSNIGVEQLNTPSAPFRVNLHIPYLASDIHDDEDQASFGVPFTLPPLQEFFDVTTATTGSTGEFGPNITDTTPRIMLDEFSFSFGQRAENAAIADQFYGDADGTAGRDGESGDTGKMTFDGSVDLNLRISLREKAPMRFSTVGYPNAYDVENVEIQKEVFGIDVPNTFFLDPDVRLNPFVVTDINKSINPYSTYMLVIEAPGLVKPSSGGNKTLCLPSVQASLRFRHPLVTRDMGADIQNLPDNTTQNNRGAKGTRAAAGASITITEPAAGSIITADQAGGVSNEMATIDKVFKDKLKGGYDEYAMRPALEELQEDAGYEVITVPLFNNRVNGGILENDIASEPYVVTSGGNQTQVWDRRIIPLSYPISVHHVVLAWNWSAFFPRTGLTVPASQQVPNIATFEADVGVGIGTGLRSDGWGYNQLARLAIRSPTDTSSATNIPPATWRFASIDRIKYRRRSILRQGSVLTNFSESQRNAWDWELHQVPIVTDGVTNGAGYFTQGKPFFASRTWTLNQQRNNVMSTGSPAAPIKEGQEQFLEVRMKISDTAGLNNLATGSVISGYGGHFVYIIGKKHLC